mmetsp:Transcript_86149/g.267670  ORF Transcript_86149/g.267670 Transcript_86149/m.267670 type:complete len:423 (+) Transcript_86149:227-1495(+)
MVVPCLSLSPEPRSSSSIACGRRPSMMCVAPTPESRARTQQVTLGIMPPATTPSLISSSAPARVSSGMSDSGSLTSRRSPGTSVMSTNSRALSAPAMAAAAMSALMLRKLPSASAATVATTGTMPLSRAASSTLVSTPVTSPTKPSSSSSTRFAFRRPPSTPESPTAATPAAPMVATMVLFTLPMRTMATTSMVAASVTRRPRTNFGSIPTFASQELISGPPPCTSTGFRPRSRRVAMSRIVRSGDFTMAAPPYLITTTDPDRRARPGRLSAKARARSARLSGARSASSSSLAPAELANLISSPWVAASLRRGPRSTLARVFRSRLAPAQPAATVRPTRAAWCSGTPCCGDRWACPAGGSSPSSALRRRDGGSRSARPSMLLVAGTGDQCPIAAAMAMGPHSVGGGGLNGSWGAQAEGTVGV